MTKTTTEKTDRNDITFQVRPQIPDDTPAIQDVMRKVYPSPPHGPEAVWPTKNLGLHITRFPMGQMVAANQDGQLIGTSTSMRVSVDKALLPHTWSEISGYGTLSTHEPFGDALYGLDIAVVPDYQGYGVASALYEARLRLARKLGCKAFVAGARIPGYAAKADKLTPGEYVEKVKSGELFDPTLSKQIRLGFQIRGLLKDYFSDPETLNYAVLIYMEL